MARSARACPLPRTKGAHVGVVVPKTSTRTKFTAKMAAGASRRTPTCCDWLSVRRVAIANARKPRMIPTIINSWRAATYAGGSPTSPTSWTKFATVEMLAPRVPRAAKTPPARDSQTVRSARLGYNPSNPMKAAVHPAGPTTSCNTRDVISVNAKAPQRPAKITNSPPDTRNAVALRPSSEFHKLVVPPHCRRR